ncbi:MAG: ATP-grasp domain-containing protein [Defluviitaleaceae bacterium]|nr:ATP-grasp domain-containing protein [Defluviitaleaceae bacterium]
MNFRNELINEICKENGINVEYLSQKYILRLTKDSTTRHIFGPYWDINNAAADRLACDKCGCYTILNNCRVPAIEHKMFFNPLQRAYLLAEEGTMQNALAFFEANNQQVVVKPNQGAQGKDVFYCDSPLALEQAIQTIFTTDPDVALCPYHEIYTEYRVFYLNGRTHYYYGKTKGDNWKHNLSQGAKAFEVSNNDLRDKLAKLAIQAAKAIDINFATIDIASLENNELAIMEINAGVQAQHLLEQLPHRHKTIKAIYAEAICSMFG